MGNASTAKNIENIRAQKAYEFADKAKNIENYDSHVKKIPAMIQTTGLSATLAFVFTQNKTSYKTIYTNIFNWLRDKECPVNHFFQDNFDEKALVQKIVSLNSNDYRAVTVEILAFFNWLRRFADGLCEGKPKKDNDDE